MQKKNPYLGSIKGVHIGIVNQKYAGDHSIYSQMYRYHDAAGEEVARIRIDLLIAPRSLTDRASDNVFGHFCGKSTSGI